MLNNIHDSVNKFNYISYKKHASFFKEGNFYKERFLLGGNRVGKTFSGWHETYQHATGYYNNFWPGKIFSHPLDILISGLSRKVMVETLDDELKDFRFNHRYIDYNHSRLPSRIDYISQQEGIIEYIEDNPGLKYDVIWLDECPDINFYQSVKSLLKENGIIYSTLTPINNDIKNLGTGFIQTIAWEDAIHLSEDNIKALSSVFKDRNSSEFLARSKGIYHANP